MYSKARTAFLAAAIVGALAAATSGRGLVQSTSAKTAAGSISGRVLIGDKPAPSITVLLMPADYISNERPIAKATTDQDGRFHLTGVPEGQHLLQAFAPALIAAARDNMRGNSGTLVSLTAGESAENIDIVLIRGGVITGKVSDTDGQPLVQEAIRLIVLEEQGAKHPLYLPNSSYMSTTDDRGVYRLFGVPAGRYIVSVGVDTKAPNTRMGVGDTYYPLTYHPDAADETKATVVEITAGGEADDVDIRVGKISRGYSVSGRIIDGATGKPVVGMIYGYGALSPDGNRIMSTSSASSTSNSRGEFRIDGITPGGYAAFAYPLLDSEMYSDTARFTITDSDVAGIEVKVHRGSSVMGAVVIEGAEGQQGLPRLSDLRINVMAGTTLGAPRSSVANVAADGSFRATGLQPGKAQFYFGMYPPPKGLSLLRVERDGVEQKGGLEISAGEQISGVTLVLSYGTAIIRGQTKVEGGELSESSRIVISWRRTGTDERQVARPVAADSRGRFVIEGLLPGEYELSLVFRDASGGGRQAPSKLVKQTVSVANGTEIQVTMVVDLSGKNQ